MRERNSPGKALCLINCQPEDSNSRAHSFHLFLRFWGPPMHWPCPLRGCTWSSRWESRVAAGLSQISEQDNGPFLPAASPCPEGLACLALPGSSRLWLGSSSSSPPVAPVPVGSVDSRVSGLPVTRHTQAKGPSGCQARRKLGHRRAMA